MVCSLVVYSVLFGFFGVLCLVSFGFGVKITLRRSLFVFEVELIEVAFLDSLLVCVLGVLFIVWRDSDWLRLVKVWVFCSMQF